MKDVFSKLILLEEMYFLSTNNLKQQCQKLANATFVQFGNLHHQNFF